MAKTLSSKEKRINEVFGVLLLLSGLFAFISLLFFHPGDHSFYTSHPNESYRNITGIAGVYLAHYLELTFGLSAFGFPFLFLFWSICFFLQKVPQRKWPELVGILVSLVSIASLIALAAPADWKVRAGGVLGYFFAAHLETYFGFAGGLIVGLCCLFLAFILATDFLLYPLMTKIWLSLSASWIDLKASAREVIDLFRPQKNESAGSQDSLLQKFEPPKVKSYLDRSDRTAREFQTAQFKEAELSQEAFIEREIAQVKTKKAKESITKPVPEAGSVSPKPGAQEFELPPVTLLRLPRAEDMVQVDDDLQQNSRILEETLLDFGIEAKVLEVEQGPVITRYELLPAPGVKVHRIVSLADDLALAMKTTSVRFLTPIPGKSVMGIEIPNSKTTIVSLRELLEQSGASRTEHKLPLFLGKDTGGKPMVSDLSEMPHLLIAGATGSGKTVCVNSLIVGLLCSKTPDELKFVMVDPKMVELAAYKDLPHMLTPVVTDVRKAAGTLNWLVSEMERRYRFFATCGTRNIQAFNQRKKENGQANSGEIPERLPYILLVIDELADLMVVAQDKVETAITRLAQLSRAVGIHLILATQRPSVDVITGVIKANFPARISFKVTSKVDSRTVLDMNGADKLVGKGDMLFLEPGQAKPTRGQAAFITDDEINAAVQFIKDQRAPAYLPEIESASEGKSSVSHLEKDEMYEDAVRVVLETRQASVSVLQRKLRLGYGRAARIIDMMEQEGIVGPYQGSKSRDILAENVRESADSSQEAP